MQRNEMRRRHSSDTMNLSGRSTDSDVEPLVENKDLKRFYQCRQTIMLVYVLHWSLTLLILVLGMMQNGGDRKYIPVDAIGLESLISNEFHEVIYGSSCLKAYVDVHTSSIEDQLAMVCCTKKGAMPIPAMPKALEQYQSDLCNPRLPYFNTRTQQLPFQKRLSRFPEAWILPMLPILVRIIFQLISSLWILIRRIVKKPTVVKSPSLNSKSSSSFVEKIALATSTESWDTTSKVLVSNQLRSTLKRLSFYFIILNLRGWVLYIGANAIEDYCIVPWFTGNEVISPLRTNSISDVEHKINSSNNECWYKAVLKAHHRNEMKTDYYSDCYGRPFDFSDHIVLFLAHHLPIFVMETVICFMFPFWPIQNQSSLKWCISGTFVILHLVLFLYMHVIVLHATYQTTAYFHTNAEIIVGYLLSLFIQVPVMYLLCSTKWKVLRQFIGLPVEQVTPVKSV